MFSTLKPENHDTNNTLQLFLKGQYYQFGHNKKVPPKLKINGYANNLIINQTKEVQGANVNKNFKMPLFEGTTNKK